MRPAHIRDSFVCLEKIYEKKFLGFTLPGTPLPKWRDLMVRRDINRFVKGAVERNMIYQRASAQTQKIMETIGIKWNQLK